MMHPISYPQVLNPALRQGTTQPPPKMSERDLISAMERHGIGTDATTADHIQKQLDRGYALKDNAQLFFPTTLGEALVASYHKMGLSNLWQPSLRCGPISISLMLRVAKSHIFLGIVLAHGSVIHACKDVSEFCACVLHPGVKGRR